MRIAFDLDDTLICCRYTFPSEKPGWPRMANILTQEQLREGTREVFQFCQKQGWQTWIYTTSYRNPFYIRTLFWLYGIRLHGVVTQAKHVRHVTVSSSKYPPQFGINCLIDDSEGVKQESEKYGFWAIRIAPDDHQWVTAVKTQLAASSLPRK